MENNNLRTDKGKVKSRFEQLKDYKTEIFIAVTAVAGIALSCFACRKIVINKTTGINATPPKLNIFRDMGLKEANQCIDAENISRKFCNVRGHVRTLSDGLKPSQKQLDIAKKLNIALSDKQTYVIEHKRNAA